jgi:hypothetical protein
MRMDWLLGPRAQVEGDHVTVQSRYVIDLSDWADILESSEAVAGPLRAVRANGWGEDALPTNDSVDLAESSDTDTAAVMVIPTDDVRPASAIYVLGQLAQARFRISVVQHSDSTDTSAAVALHRIATILNGKRRRIPSWKWFQVLERAVDALLVLVVVGSFLTADGGPWIAATAALAALAVRPVLLGRLRTTQVRHRRFERNVGQVIVDASLRREVRLRRANGRRDAVVAVIAAAVGAALTALGTK